MRCSRPPRTLTLRPLALLCVGWLASACGDSGGAGGAGGAGGGGDGAAPGGFAESYELDAQFPEGGIFDPTGQAFFVGSLGDGSIHRVDVDSGAQELFFEETAEGAWWSLGMAVDDQRRRLWVCAMEDLRETGADPQYDGYVWSFDLESGERDLVVPLSDAFPEATCTDVAVAADGTVYVTDRDFGNVYTVTADGEAAQFASTALLEGGLVGQNAAVLLPDESALLIAVYLPPRLVRVDLPDGTSSDVAIEGTFEDDAFLAGADGMTYADGSLYVAFSSILVKLSPDDEQWLAATATSADVPEGMTDVIATPGGLYLLNGQAVRYAFEQPTDPFQLARFDGEL